MKWIVLASALAFGGTAVAQEMQTQPATPPVTQQTQPGTMGNMPAPGPGTMPPPTTDTTTTTAPIDNGMTPGGMTTAADATPATPAPAGRPMQDGMMASTGDDPRGGYMPSGPAMSGPMTPGARVIFRPSMTPDQAFPAPAPLQAYPICKRGQYDNCRQRGG